MSVYSKLPARVQTLIRRFGRAIVLVNKAQTGTEYDPTITETIKVATAVVMPISISVSNDNLLKQGDKQFMILTDLKLTLDTIIRDTDGDYQIVKIDEVKPGDTILMYNCIGRK